MNASPFYSKTTNDAGVSTQGSPIPLGRHSSPEHSGPLISNLVFGTPGPQTLVHHKVPNTTHSSNLCAVPRCARPLHSSSLLSSCRPSRTAEVSHPPFTLLTMSTQGIASSSSLLQKTLSLIFCGLRNIRGRAAAFFF